MKILVTGGVGFIGSHVVDGYIDTGYKVVVIDDLSTGTKENVNKKAKFYLADICDKNKIERIFKKEKPEVLNHHAAQKNVRASVSDPAFDAQVNILGGLNLLEAARKNKIKKVIFASSGGAIYGDCKNIPTPETEKELPVSPYGIAKLSFEKYLYYYHWQYKIPYIALRYANVYGPRQDPAGEAGVVAIFCQNLVSGKKSVIFGDGKQTRDYVYIENVVKANIEAVKNKFTGEINIGTAKETNVNDLYKMLADIAKSKIPFPKHLSAKPGEQKRSCLDFKKAKKVLGWQPKTNSKEGLKKTFSYYLDLST